MESNSLAPRGFERHNQAWLTGRHAVLETLRAGRWRPLEVALAPRCPEEIAQEVRKWCRTYAVPLIEETDAGLTRRSRTDEHQGMAARMPPFPYTNWEHLLARQPFPGCWMILDRIHDSHNFGAMIRSAVGLGVEALVVGTSHQSAVNRQVVTSSAGLINHLLVVEVPDLVAAVSELQRRGVRVVACSEKAPTALADADFSGPLAVIVGNEGHGPDPALLARADQVVAIPMSPRVDSLNAAVAVGIVCYEMQRQRTAAAKEPHR
jgi:23S rRNA (guanosine2251-2'-O)-methyltransferase